MVALRIHHRTTYHYRKPVAFGEHRMMLRPHNLHSQRVIGEKLQIDPMPESLWFVSDQFDNQIGIARFSTLASELRFESIVRIEMAPDDSAGVNLDGGAAAGSTVYCAEERTQLLPFLDRHCPDPNNDVASWAHNLLPPDTALSPIHLLACLSGEIKNRFLYRRRDAKGIQLPAETLFLGHGSCRDFAVLLMDAARALGLAARFTSGYLAIPLDHPEDVENDLAHGATHAWAQIYLAGMGWIDVDPTSGTIGKKNLVSVAVVRDPDDAIPLHGTYYGAASDHIGMDVRVSVLSEAPNAFDDRSKGSGPGIL